jgi:hypothetical protein
LPGCLNNHLGPLQIDLFVTRFFNQLVFSAGGRILKQRPQMLSCRTGPDLPILFGASFLRCSAKYKQSSGRTTLAISSPVPGLGRDPDIEIFQLAGVLTPSLIMNRDCPVGETPPRLLTWKVYGKGSE